MSEPKYIEVWEVSGNPNGDRLGIAYTKSKCPTYEMLLALRNDMAEEYHCKLEHLLRTDEIWIGEDDEIFCRRNAELL